MAASQPLLEVRSAVVGYGQITALHGIDIEVRAGEAVAILGANGAGKSTLLNSIVGFNEPRSGGIFLNGAPLKGLRAEKRVKLGLGYCPEGREVFQGMSVRDNLEVACNAGAAERRRRIDDVLDFFPQLATRVRTPGWQLSGGQQQMLAIGRALMGKPRLLLLDEPSLGLSPLLVRDVLDRVKDIVAQGTSVLLAEQNVSKALKICHRAYVLQVGKVVQSGKSSELLKDGRMQEAFLGA
ncbi:MAG: ABC transporter ATP-binding protein [Alphaproteobacteria bacterium]